MVYISLMNILIMLDGVNRVRVSNVIFQNLEMFLSSSIEKYAIVVSNIHVFN